MGNLLNSNISFNSREEFYTVNVYFRSYDLPYTIGVGPKTTQPRSLEVLDTHFTLLLVPQPNRKR